MEIRTEKDERIGLDVHEVAYWRLPRAFTSAWASEELGSSLNRDAVTRQGKGWDEGVSTRLMRLNGRRRAKRIPEDR